MLAECGGRVNILELPAHIGVNLDIIERAMDSFLKRNKVALVNGQLISQLYLDQLLEEVCELLADAGQVLLHELTTRYNLPLDYIRDCVQSRLESHLPPGATLQGNCLMTRSFAERQLCKVRGLMRAITRPAALSAIANTYKMEE